MAMQRVRILTAREFPDRRCRSHGIVAWVMCLGSYYHEARWGPAHPPCHGVRAGRIISVHGKSAGGVYRLPDSTFLDGTRGGLGVA